MFCPRCGKELPEAARFCAACGSPAENQKNDTTPQVKKKNKTALTVSLVSVILALAVVAAGVVMIFVGGKKGTVTAVTNPDFELSDGFIIEIDSTNDVPDGYIGIDSASKLEKLGGNSSAKYILTKDIELDPSFETIKYFSGTLDGNGHIISGVKYTLIKEAEGAVIKNLGIRCDIDNDIAAIARKFSDGTLDNCYVTGTVRGNYGGGLVSSCSSSVIKNCYNAAQVTAIDGTAGGLFYSLSDGCKVENCYNSGQVSSLTYGKSSHVYLGGIAAFCSRGSIIGCYNSGYICFTNYDSNFTDSAYSYYVACGIVGEADPTEGDSLKIAYCYNSGDVKGDLSFAITAAWTECAARVTVTDCYNTGEFKDNNSYGMAGCLYGGLGKVTSVKLRNCINATSSGKAALSNNSSDIENCYYIESHSRVTAVDALFSDVHALTLKQMKKEKSFDLDFDTAWQMGGDHPVFAYGSVDEIK